MRGLEVGTCSGEAGSVSPIRQEGRRVPGMYVSPLPNLGPLETMKIKYALVLSLMSLLAVACSKANEHPKSNELAVRGKIDEEMVRRLSAVDWNGIGSIRFESFGGDPASAVAVARILKDTGKTIVVDGVCLSACLMIAVIDGDQVEFGPNSVLVIHNSASSAYYMSSRLYPSISNSYYKPRMDLERAWLVENNVDPRLLLLPQLAIETPCIAGPKLDDPVHSTELKFASRYLGWLLPLEAARDFGMKFRGQWNEAPGRVNAIFFAASQGASSAELSFSVPTPKALALTERELSEMLAAIPMCLV